MNARGRMLAQIVSAIVIASTAVSIPAQPVRAATRATLDCSSAVGNGAVGATLPSPDVAERSYLSRFWYKFDGGFAGTGHDWVVHDYWFFGDSQDAYIWNSTDAAWTGLDDGLWVFHGVWNTGTVYVWEEQYYYDTDSWVGNDLGSCVTYQYTVFYPFAG